MKLAIMQPYLFPYIGYFQLMNLADTFVVYDDVQYINRGWINRNNILVSGSKSIFSFSVIKDSSHKNINERYFDKNRFEIETKKFLKTLTYSYSKAPYFQKVYSLIESILIFDDFIVSEFINNSLINICNYIGITTKLIKSSDINIDNALKSQDRILALCEALGAKQYTNPIGGVELYSKSKFNEQGIELNFIKTDEIIYKQFSNDFVSNLSIIDVMMFNSPYEIKEMLNQYELV